MSNTIGLEASNLVFSYKKPVVRNLSLRLERGIMTGMIGPNGSGKTTILRLLAGILQPNSGNVLLGGHLPLNRLGRKEIARHIAVVPQSDGTYNYHTVFQFVLLGRSPHLSLLGFESVKDEEIALKALEMTHLAHMRDAGASEISGGEKQRLLLARALAQQTEILMLDELTANLDINYQVELIRMISQITRQKNLATLVVSHEINLLAAFCSHIVLIGDGAIRSQGSVSEVITRENLMDLFGMDFSVRATNSGTREVMPQMNQGNIE
jgi:iron complex transport system ATP-binding protein